MTRPEIFTVLGEVRLVDDSKRFVPDSPGHMRSCIARLSIGQKVACTFSEAKGLRSGAQLRYHFVLMGYLADHTGYTREEMHDAIMRLRFGVKSVELKGIRVTVRKSLSESGRASKREAQALIDYDLELCAGLGIAVPTMEELGYVSNYQISAKANG